MEGNMNINIDIQEELWQVIQENYENNNYSGSILDAMHLLTETIRNKTGLEGDGSNLIGQAFGGENPRIKLNKLQTDSEKNIQKGTQEILKGFYTSIRNPRSHDKLDDKKTDADAIIVFINYMLSVIDKSKLSFQENDFLERVFDTHYVKDKNYSDLLVLEIPARQRVNIAISVILQRTNGDIYNLAYFMEALFNKLDENGISRVYKVVSEELKLTNSEENIRTILHICPAKYWPKLDKAVKLRIENILFENVKKGIYDSESDSLIDGALGTWIEYEHLINFEHVNNWTYMIVEKLKKGGREKDYVDKWFWTNICSVNRDNIHFSLKYYIKKGLENRDDDIIKKLEEEISFDEEHPWWKVFEEELKEYPNIKYIDFPF